MTEREYRIDYTIYRDDEEIGFGSSGGWTSIDQCAHMVASDTDNYEWETEGDMPDPHEIKADHENRRER